MQKRVSENITGLKGKIVIPSDKSISHRAIMLSALAKGNSVITNFSSGEDCKSTLKLFQQLGVDISYKDFKTVVVKSSGKLVTPKTECYCANSGTTMRLASGILAGQCFDSILTGDESLSKRPMKRIIEPLSQMGAKITSDNGHAPLKIYGTKLCGINYVSKLSSAQVKSSVLLAGLNADGKTTYTEPEISRNHTELMLKYLGADIELLQNKTIILPSTLSAKDIEIVGDISSASFFIVAGLIVPNSDITIKNIGLNPTRTGIIDVVQKMNGNIEILNKREVAGEIVGDIRVKYTENLKACEIFGKDIPRLIDEIPVIAVLATQADGVTIIKDAQDLRNKETDRIKFVVDELKKLGAEIEEKSDGFIVSGKTTLKGNCELESYKDHRIAMSLYVAGLICKKEISIKDFEWIKISFPEFEELMNCLQ